LHRALAAVWATLGNSDRLQAASPDELHAIVSQAVDAALASDPVATIFRAQLRRAEAERLVKLIEEWLEREKSRPTGFRVRDIEREFNHQLSRLQLRVRADRIDELPDGRLIVIDYKSGKADRANLDNERPKEPQLLVYAALLGEQVDGLYFASIRREEGGVSGYGQKAHFGDKREAVPEWEARLDSWRNTVTRLAQGFESGWAPVDPSRGACDWCRIKPICRIEENRRIGQEEGE
jgi:RecB family exonuclease